MKTIRTTLSIFFLGVAIVLLSMLVYSQFGGNSVIAEFLLSSYSYMAYSVPVYYIWFFVLFYRKDYDTKNALWPILSLVPFLMFSLALRLQFWDYRLDASPPLEGLSVLIGSVEATIVLLYIVGSLFTLGELLLYSFFRQSVLEGDIDDEDDLIDFAKYYHQNQQKRTEYDQNYPEYMGPTFPNAHNRSNAHNYHNSRATEAYARAETAVAEETSAEEVMVDTKPATEPVVATAKETPKEEDNFLLLFNRKNHRNRSSTASQKYQKFIDEEIYNEYEDEQVDEYDDEQYASSYSERGQSVGSSRSDLPRVVFQSPESDRVHKPMQDNKSTAQVEDNNTGYQYRDLEDEEYIGEYKKEFHTYSEGLQDTEDTVEIIGNDVFDEWNDSGEEVLATDFDIVDYKKTEGDSAALEAFDEPLDQETLSQKEDFLLSAQDETHVHTHHDENIFEESVAVVSHLGDDFDRDNDFEGDNDSEGDRDDNYYHGNLDDPDSLYYDNFDDDVFLMADNEMADNEMADNEMADNEMADNEMADNEMVGNEMVGNEMADNEMVGNEILDTGSRDDFFSTEVAVADIDETFDHSEFLEDSHDTLPSEHELTETSSESNMERSFVTNAMSAANAEQNAYSIVDSEIAPDTQVATQVEASFTSKEEAREILKKKTIKKGAYKIPIAGILEPSEEIIEIDHVENERIARALEDTLREFNIEAEVVAIGRGPVVTMFEILPAAGVRLRRIVELSDNIALRLAAPSIRIVAPIPGKEAVGIEVPNKDRETVAFAELIADRKFQNKEISLPIALGKNISNDIQIIDLAKTPHLLIAGATGSGKSVCINAIICSLLYRCSPDDVKLILIDPKIVELSFYNGIPHLLTPVVSDPIKSLQAIRWCVEEMEYRYKELEAYNVREITSYRRKLKEKKISAKVKGMPYIVVVIDEFADLMMTCGKEMETLVSRIAAKSRAVGIHLVVATQRPSTDVITGLIKSNIPSRISFMVTSKIDSRIILDTKGAETLLGKGDMLYSSSTDPFPERMQGPYLSELEVERVVEYIKDSYGEPEYISEAMFETPAEENDTYVSGDDPLWKAAVEEVVRAQRASASHLQRRFKIGYNRAARLIEDMEAEGLIGPPQGSKAREVYAEAS